MTRHSQVTVYCQRYTAGRHVNFFPLLSAVIQSTADNSTGFVKYSPTKFERVNPSQNTRDYIVTIL